MRHNIAALMVVTSLPALGQELPRFLESARQRNVDAALAVQGRVRADAELGQSWGALLPALTASGGYTRNQYQGAFQTSPSQTVLITPIDQLDATLKAELPLIDASRWLRTASASSSAAAAADRVQSTWQAVQRTVVADYYGYVAAEAVLDSARRSLQLAEAQAAQTRSRAQAGVANELEAVRAEAEVQRNEQLVADAESNRATSARALRTASGLEPDRVPPLPDDDLHPEAPLEELETRAGGQASVAAASRDADAASRALTAAGLALVPTVNGQFTQRFTNATGFSGETAFYNAGVTFNWRLDVPAGYGLVGQRAQVATSDLNARKALDAARDQIHADWHQVKAAVTKVRSAGAQVVSARRASALSHDRYAAGVATQTDVIQAERDLFTAEVNAIRARAELAQARAALQLSTGTSPTRDPAP